MILRYVAATATVFPSVEYNPINLTESARHTAINKTPIPIDNSVCSENPLSASSLSLAPRYCEMMMPATLTTAPMTTLYKVLSLPAMPTAATLTLPSEPTIT